MALGKRGTITEKGHPCPRTERWNLPLHCTRKVTGSIYWVGGNDRRLALFENLFPIPRGVSYNAYLISDQQTALIDTVDASIQRQFLENLSSLLEGRSLDYLVVNHMEPDHCAVIEELTQRYPSMKLVGNEQTFQLIRQFYHLDLTGRTITIREGDTLSLGSHQLRFLFAPMVHWPEVMMCYEEKEKILFSADAFGSFGALNGALFSDEVDFPRDWLPDSRRYYANIVGKYGPQVQAVLQKAAALEIRMLCPLHGPVWRQNLSWILEKYDRWSRYQPEENAVALFYASMYGDTQNAAEVLACSLGEAGCPPLGVHDVSGEHVSYLIAEAFQCSHLVLAAPTYNLGLYPAMENFLLDMKALRLKNRTVALMENGSWACNAGQQMRRLLGEMQGMHLLSPTVTITSSLREDQLPLLFQLRDALVSSLKTQS